MADPVLLSIILASLSVIPFHLWAGAVGTLSAVSLSTVSVNHGQPQSKTIKLKFPEINNS